MIRIRQASPTQTKSTVASVGRVSGFSSRMGQTTANTSTGVPIAGMGGMVTGINLDPMLWEILPDTLDQFEFPEHVMRVYRDIYFFDSVAGATIDLMSQLPFSNWTLTGMDDSKLSPYREMLERINIEEYFPELAADYLTYGAHISSLLVNSKRKIFTDVVPLLPEHCKFVPMPIRGQDPIIEYTAPPQIRKFASMERNSRVKTTLDRLGKLAQVYKKGKMQLNPVTTLFVPRRTISGRFANSYLKRVLPIYLIEKNLWKGTMIESTRRIRSILHVQVGDQDWEPTPDQMAEISNLFVSADADPLGAVVATRNGVSTNDVRSGGDFWNIFNIWGETVPAKLRALGVSESFLSGDASYSNMETSLSTFIENLKAFRNSIVHLTLSTRLFPLVSLMHRHIKKGEKLPAELASALSKGSIDRENIIRAIQDTKALEIPNIVWTKTLEPKGDQQYLELLNSMQEKGVPVFLRAWAAAGGIDLNDFEKAYSEDIDSRVKVAEYKAKLGEALAKVNKKNAPEGGGEGGGEEDTGDEGDKFGGEFSDAFDFDDEELDGLPDLRIYKVKKEKPRNVVYNDKEVKEKVLKARAANSVRGPALGGGLKLNWARRDYGEMAEIVEPTKSGRGIKPVRNQAQANEKMNKQIATALTSLAGKRK